MTSQIRRCAISVPSNMAEGHGRNSTNEYLHFLRIATGSLYELQIQMEISMNLHYLNRGDFDKLYELSREIERMLSSLIRKVKCQIGIKARGKGTKWQGLLCVSEPLCLCAGHLHEERLL